ncbi:MAG: tRNA (guanosine(46)-N7)-methyltransferase TrmB [Clostridia bacterium]
MRIRTKKWARPELAVCDYYIQNPKEMKGKWQDFFEDKSEIHLDLGCGKCTFMADLAYQNKNINHIAVDISVDILGVARRNIQARFGEEKVKNVALMSYNIEQIKDFISKEDKVTRIYINFCNPWSSSKTHKRRLTHPRQLVSYLEILDEDGEIWFKSDDDNLYYSTRDYFNECGLEIFFDTKDLNSLENTGNIQSEHEVKFEAMGIKTKAIRARRKKITN